MLMEKAEIIDNNTEFKLLAQGITAEVYLYGNGKILKLFRENMPIEPITAEYKKAELISSDLHNVPKAYKIIEYRGRFGIVYEKIDGSDMISAMLKGIGRVKEYSKQLARIHFELHSHKTDVGCYVKSKLGLDVEGASFLSKAEKEKVKSYLQALPDRNELLHFDFHPGNILISGGEPIVIDWMTACTGDRCADAARTCLLLQYGELGYANFIVRKAARVFEKYIGKIYIEEYKRISGVSQEDIDRWLLPVAAGRLREWVTDGERKRLLRLVRGKLGELD